MSTTCLLTSLALLACYFPVAVLSVPAQINYRRSAVTYEYVSQCEDTGGAVLSECQALVSSLGNTTTLNYDNKCSQESSSDTTTFSPICSQNGECCIYTTQVTSTPEILQQFGQVILKNCAGEGKTILGAVRDEHHNRFCLASGSECGSCFH